jgi:hypothetical protein
VRVSGDTRGSLRASFLNIGLVEGGVRAVRSEQFSVSSKLSDCLHRRGERVSKKRRFNKTPDVCKKRGRDGAS